MALTHEQFIKGVQAVVASRCSAELAERIHRVKLSYGFGKPGLRGVTIYSAWANGHGPSDPDPFVEICAAGEESTVQLAGTVVHELGHVVAGWNAGHSNEWKQACSSLGLNCVRAAGTRYSWSMFHPALRLAIVALGEPTDGKPMGSLGQAQRIGLRRQGPATPPPCTAGIGTKGGKSRGQGSGSRMRKYVCSHGQIVRAATDCLNATCNECGTAFEIRE